LPTLQLLLQLPQTTAKDTYLKLEPTNLVLCFFIVFIFAFVISLLFIVGSGSYSYSNFDSDYDSSSAQLSTACTAQWNLEPNKQVKST